LGSKTSSVFNLQDDNYDTFDNYLKNIERKNSEYFLLNKSYNSGERILFKPVKIFDDSIGQKYCIVMYGHFNNGERAVISLTNIEPILDISVKDDAYIPDLQHLLSTKTLKDPIIKAKHIRPSASVKDWYRLRFTNLFQRLSCLKKEIDLTKFDVSNDQRTSYYDVFQKTSNIKLSSWITFSFDKSKLHKYSRIVNGKQIYFINYTDVVEVPEQDSKLLSESTPIITFDTETFIDYEYANKYEKDALTTKVPNVFYKSTKISYISYVLSYSNHIISAGSLSYISDIKQDYLQIDKVYNQKDLKELDIILCTNEKDMISSFYKIIKTFNPNIICGFNDTGYDWPLMLCKTKEYNLFNLALPIMTGSMYYNYSPEDDKSFNDLEKTVAIANKKTFSYYNHRDNDDDDESDDDEPENVNYDDDVNEDDSIIPIDDNLTNSEFYNELDDSELNLGKDSTEEKSVYVFNKFNYKASRKIDATSFSTQFFPNWNTKFIAIDIRYYIKKIKPKIQSSLNALLSEYKIGKKADISHTVAQYYSKLIYENIKKDNLANIDSIVIEPKHYDEMDEVGVPRDIRSLVNQMSIYSIMDSILTLELYTATQAESNLMGLAFYSNTAFESCYSRGSSYIVSNACHTVAETLPIPIKFDTNRPEEREHTVVVKDMDAGDYWLHLNKVKLQSKEDAYLTDLSKYTNTILPADDDQYPGAYVFSPDLNPIYPDKSFKELYEITKDKKRTELDLEVEKIKDEIKLINGECEFEEEFKPAHPELLVYIKILNGKHTCDLENISMYLRSYLNKLSAYENVMSADSLFKEEYDKIIENFESNRNLEINKYKNFKKEYLKTLKYSPLTETIGYINNYSYKDKKFIDSGLSLNDYIDLYMTCIYVDSELQKYIYEHDNIVSFKYRYNKLDKSPNGFNENKSNINLICLQLLLKKTLDKYESIRYNFAIMCEEYIKLEEISHFTDRQKLYVLKSFSVPVFSLDFNSLYPSIIIAFNMSSEKMIISTGNFETLNRLSSDNKYNTISFLYGKKDYPNSAHFEKHDNDRSKYGLYPETLTRLADKRKAKKQEMEYYYDVVEYYKKGSLEERIGKTITNIDGKEISAKEITKDMVNRFEVVANNLNIQQNAIKVLMNTIYGNMGNKMSSAKATELSGGITRMGVVHIKKSRDLCISLGCSIKYGDTDSLYICVPETMCFDILLKSVKGEIGIEELTEQLIERTFDVKDEIETKVNDNLFNITGSRTLKMSFEKVCFPMKFVSKKKYICKKCEKKEHAKDFGNVTEKTITTTGMDFTKRNSKKISKDEFVKIIINFCTISKYAKPIEDYAIESILSIGKKLSSDDIFKEIQNSIFVSSLSKPEVAKIIVNMKNKYEVNINDMLNVVVYERNLFDKVKISGSLVSSKEGSSDRKVDINYIIQEGLNVDREYYLYSLTGSLSVFFSHLAKKEIVKEFENLEVLYLNDVTKKINKTTTKIIDNIVSKVSNIKLDSKSVDEIVELRKANKNEYINRLAKSKNIPVVTIKYLITFGKALSGKIVSGGFQPKEHLSNDLSSTSFILVKPNETKEMAMSRLKYNILYIFNFMVLYFKSTKLIMKPSQLYNFLFDNFYSMGLDMKKINGDGKNKLVYRNTIRVATNPDNYKKTFKRIQNGEVYSDEDFKLASNFINIFIEFRNYLLDNKIISAK
jgi:DNA polymerase elongation subunit (family B)